LPRPMKARESLSASDCTHPAPLCDVTFRHGRIPTRPDRAILRKLKFCKMPHTYALFRLRAQVAALDSHNPLPGTNGLPTCPYSNACSAQAGLDPEVHRHRSTPSFPLAVRATRRDRDRRWRIESRRGDRPSPDQNPRHRSVILREHDRGPLLEGTLALSLQSEHDLGKRKR